MITNTLNDPKISFDGHLRTKFLTDFFDEKALLVCPGGNLITRGNLSSFPIS